ncbi:unnamed protein product [Tuber melanosporum]|uniref:(Perigord truffle) hypothetical protein n=1 Tax=Tuber melanosporum (strain Mel28) TaxID=656061 RepID=D5GBS4_TUBMM|nr:unnamed protein product [Tuber melanosporum]
MDLSLIEVGSRSTRSKQQRDHYRLGQAK